MKKKQFILYTIEALVLVLLISASIYAYQSINKTEETVLSQQATSTTVDSNKISYNGEDGVTALVLLEKNANVVTNGIGEMAFVTSINDVAADPSSEFWSFSINGEPALVGAGSYITKNSDVIKWELKSF